MLNFDNTVLESKPRIVKREKLSNSGNRRAQKLTFISFKFQNVNNMLFIYDYFMHNRLYCDMKFYRVTKIKSFIQIRKYKTFPKDSVEQKIYLNFLTDWFKYDNPL